MGDENNKYSLTWDNFENNIIEAFRNLRSEEDFYDCTIVCKDSKIRAHRVILSAFSPSFRDMIRCTAHHHPVLYLRGVRVKDLEGLLDFMYHGEVFLEEEELETFLKTAEDLQVRGLCQVGGRSGEGSNIDSAIDEDVQSLLRTLDEPASKRIKHDPEKIKENVRSGGLLSSLGPGVSVSVKREPGGSIQDRRQSSNSGQTSLEALRNSVNSPAGSTASDTQETLKSLMLKSNTTPMKTTPPVSSSFSQLAVNSVKSTFTPVKFTTSTTVTPVKVSQPSTPLKHPLQGAGSPVPNLPVSSIHNSSTQLTRPALVQMQSVTNNPGLVQSQVRGLPTTQSNTKFAGLQFSKQDISRSQVAARTSSPPVLHLPDNMSTFPVENRYQKQNASTAQGYQISTFNNTPGYQTSSNTNTGYQISTSSNTHGYQTPNSGTPQVSQTLTSTTPTVSNMLTSSSVLTMLTKGSTAAPQQFSRQTLVPTNLTTQTLVSVLSGHANEA